MIIGTKISVIDILVANMMIKSLAVNPSNGGIPPKESMLRVKTALLMIESFLVSILDTFSVFVRYKKFIIDRDKRV